MFKIGNRVKVDSRDGEVYGVVVGIDNDVVTVAIGEDRVVNAHYESVFHDEGYSRLKGGDK